MGKEGPGSMEEMSFSMQVVYDDMQAIIGQFNQTYGEQISKEMISCQNEALKALDTIRNSKINPTNRTELIAKLNHEKDEGKISEPAYDLIVGIL